MQKASNKILPRRWKNRGKVNSSSISAIWKPEGCCTWGSVSGRKVILQPVSILTLTKAVEQEALRKVALTKAQKIMPDCTIEIPKACVDAKRQKRLKKRSQSVNLGGLLSQKEEPRPVGLVFEIPLSRCIANENNLKKRRNKSLGEATEKRELKQPCTSSEGSTEALIGHNGNAAHPLETSNNRSFHAGSTDSLSESEGNPEQTDRGSSLIEALSLSISGRESVNDENLQHLSGDGPMVPQIVLACFRHIETYGFHVLGIFRVGCSKKRVKQLRDEFDSGKDVILDESQNPHDVGALLKEFFRDLPEPLLTRDLYSPFVATRRINNPEKQILALKLLVSLLPVPNRDTLWALMKFLRKVAQHSTDTIDKNGQTLPGNRMDSTNLATLFGPNILHKAKVGERKYMVESCARAEERKDVIEVVKTMIEDSSIFEIPPNIYDEVLRYIMEDNPEVCDKLLKHIASDSGVDVGLETSYGSVFSEGESQQNLHPRQTHRLCSSVSDAGDSRGANLHRQLSSQSSYTSCPSDSERDDTDPRQAGPDYHRRQARMILRQRCKTSTDLQLSPTGLNVSVPVRNTQQLQASGSQTSNTTLTVPQQSQYIRQNSCPGLCSSSISPPSSSSSSSYFTPSTSVHLVDQRSPKLGLSKSERELSQTGYSRLLAHSRESSPASTPPRITTTSSSLSSPSSSSTPPTSFTSLQQGPPLKAPNSQLQRIAEWQRERWRQWGHLTSDKSEEKKEHETLV
ncbi:rho GTPase-activating protein 6-like [Octopus sinensis]|uniref:Rho GTPase-activating protein 6-like n=1 Tax=Octopus sinensis TaxID=2607531 RepID=A0A6P7T6D2_9MOLL|nr:rho GTPase-activating protein 6-like [Octopus sinensis]XP_036365888.1 rho GTPase-activating protein 6-like [Octopus sinensis]XP_036365889.1 rho GTPase-activating protein 6-like [Octopus sinensis]XP_036365890.1 rho GTPase-activating protein 6-like [Octopus sinensis]